MTHIWKNVLVLQKKVLRVIAGVPPRTHTDNLFVQFDIFPVKRHCVYTICIFMYKYDNGMLPELFCDMVTPVNHIHDHETRQAKSKNLYVSFRPTSKDQKYFTISGPLVWNFVISKMNPSCTICSFKKLLRQILQLCSIADLPWWLCFSWLWLPTYCSLKSYNRHLCFIIISNKDMQWNIVLVTCTAPCLQVQILNRY